MGLRDLIAPRRGTLAPAPPPEGGACAPRDAPEWSLPEDELFARLRSVPAGLSRAEAASRSAAGARAASGRRERWPGWTLLAAQFSNPLILVLILAAALGAFLGDFGEASVIVGIVLASSLLGFLQEYRASQAMDALRGRIAHRARVLRDGIETTIPSAGIVVGDILLLSAGDLLPADGRIIAACDLNVSEAALTGESFPVPKRAGCVAAQATLSRRENTVYAGSSVRSGTGRVLVTRTGGRTEIAAIASTLRQAPPETDFVRGVRRFGALMIRVMIIVVIVVFVANLLLHRPLIDSLLFSIALAVGLTPELLPAIISVTLARGAHRMMAGGVVVRRLAAIENLGTMDVLCTDKTGTLTEGVVRLDGWLDPGGAPSRRVLLLARLNARLQTGMANPLDEAIATGDASAEEAAFRKRGEIPYDFVRKRLSVAVGEPAGESMLICKGAVASVLEICATMRDGETERPIGEQDRTAMDERFRAWSMQGHRVLALAARSVPAGREVGRDLEADMRLEGFLLFLDPPKEGIEKSLAALSARGIGIKVISGDSRYVAAHLAARIGLPSAAIMTGEELAGLTRTALRARVEQTDIFAEIDPNQKERIVAALRARGHVVGYLGDGINDAPALHEADVGISVDTAVDVAREAADVILLQRDLGVVARGVDDGRAIFANTMKYISITTSANLGNMISMAAASLVLPFLPMLAKQILLNNFLSDMPCLAIASDEVDDEDLETPRAWDIGYVRRFMIGFGLVSSLFDFATFGFLLVVVRAEASVFQTAWFVESLLTELVILFIIRTRRPFWNSRPGSLLAALAVLAAVVAILLPFLPQAGLLGFVPLSPGVLGGLLAITALYAAASETLKHWFFAKASGSPATTPG
jgi:Mg2+-importing ATPase